MTVKSLKKQLVAAIAMVLVSVLALSSATFAWFANNNKVTADGMTINAKAEGSLLLIADTEANLGNKATSLTFAPVKVGEDLYPVHPIYADADVTAWNHAFSDAFDIAISNSEEAAVDKDDYSNYMLKTSLWIGLDDVNDSASCGAVKVTGVTLTSAADNTLLPSARVLLVAGSKVVGVYGNGTYVSVKGDDFVPAAGETPAVPATKDTMTAIPDGGFGTVVDSLAAGGKVEVTVYVYFDGRDDNCTSEKFSAKDVTCELEFTAAPATVTP